MTISVYDTIMPAEPVEVYDDHGLTVEEWVQGHTPKYKRGSRQPISCSINGHVIQPERWHDTVIGETDNVEFRVVPFGDVVDAFRFIAAVVTFGTSEILFRGLESLIPDVPGAQGQGRQGGQIDPAKARANTVRLGQAIPELFGRYIRYPDYLNQPRRYYKDTKTQVLNLMLSVGVGEFEIDPDEVKIGETPIGEVQGASYQVFAPGADVSGVINHENWFSSPEVGSTQSSAGIRLRGPTYDERTYFGSASPSGNDIFGITVGELWTAGIEGSIKLEQSITVVDGATSSDPDTFQGAFEHLAAGMTVTVESDAGVNGEYVVSTINGTKTEITLETTIGDPVTDATVGSRVMAIDKSGTKYSLSFVLSSSSIEVQRILESGANDPDWVQLPVTSLNVEIIWEADTFTATRAGPFTVCPESETTQSIEVDIFAPQGLGTVDGESINSRSRTIRIEYKRPADVFWDEQLETVSGATRDQLGWTFTITPPTNDRYEVRVSRVGGEDVSVTALDRLEFTALRCKLPTVTSYSDITTMAVTIEGTDEISSQSNNRVNLVALRKLPEISGGALTAPVATRKISAAAAYIPKSLGYADDQIDLDELERLEGIWTPRGDTFDYVFSDGTAKAAEETVLRAGFSEMTLNNGVITPVRDEPRTTLEQGYSPENMTAPLQRQFQAKQVDEPDGVEVEYIDGTTWTTETVNAFLPGDVGVKVDKIKIDGVTDRTRAWRIGMRRRRAQRYRRWTYSFNTELDALNSQYLSYVPLLDDIPGYGKVCILEGIQSDRITVSEPVEFEAGKTHVVAYRDENGEMVGPFTATEGPDEYTILVTIPEPWPAVLPSDREPTHVYFGTTERWHFPALITEISPDGPLSASVSAVNYDARVYSDDDNAPS